MKTVTTDKLEVGNHAAHMLDLPNSGGIQVDKQGTITMVSHTDMWGTPSETHTSLIIDLGKTVESPRYITIHNSHIWLVR